MIVIWSKDNCAQCDFAKKILELNNLPFQVKMLGIDYTKEELLQVSPNARTLPQIFNNDLLIGGVKELNEYIKRGKLDD